MALLSERIALVYETAYALEDESVMFKFLMRKFVFEANIQRQGVSWTVVRCT